MWDLEVLSVLPIIVLTMQRCRIMAVKKKILKEDGQAIFEFLAFMPFLVFLFVVIVTIGNSINASINQQKFTRRYFYYLMKGNSFFPDHFDLNNYVNSAGAQMVGMTSIAYRAKADGSNSMAPCFRFINAFSGDPSESCEKDAAGGVSNYVRVYTFYGACGATFTVDGSGNPVPGFNGTNQTNLSSPVSCTIR